MEISGINKEKGLNSGFIIIVGMITMVAFLIFKLGAIGMYLSVAGIIALVMVPYLYNKPGISCLQHYLFIPLHVYSALKKNLSLQELSTQWHCRVQYGL